MKSTEMLELLREFHREKEALRKRHVAAAAHVGHYDFNNTYQYIIAREDAHVAWLQDAIAAMGGKADEVPDPEIRLSGKRAEAQTEVMRTDSQQAQQFVEKWRARIDRLPNARHRSMLRVILGETLEQKRFFDQALAGRTDLLGRRADGAGTGGGVMPTRWVE